MTEVSAKTKDHPEKVTVNYDLPESLADLVARFGEEVVAGAAEGSITISLQSFIRSHIDKTQEEIQNLVNGWLPGVRQPAVKQTALEKATSALRAMSPEDRATLLVQLKALKG